MRHWSLTWKVHVFNCNLRWMHYFFVFALFTKGTQQKLKWLLLTFSQLPCHCAIDQTPDPSEGLFSPSTGEIKTTYASCCNDICHRESCYFHFKQLLSLCIWNHIQFRLNGRYIIEPRKHRIRHPAGITVAKKKSNENAGKKKGWKESAPCDLHSCACGGCTPLILQ